MSVPTRLVSFCALAVACSSAAAQTRPTLADLRWDTTETTPGRYVIVPGQGAFVSGYGASGLEVWTPPIQLVRGYRITLRVGGDTVRIGGQELHWDAPHDAYVLDEPSHRVRGVILAHRIAAHDEWQNSARHGDFA